MITLMERIFSTVPDEADLLAEKACHWRENNIYSVTEKPQIV